jgi:hypothetical protein
MVHKNGYSKYENPTRTRLPDSGNEYQIEKHFIPLHLIPTIIVQVDLAIVSKRERESFELVITLKWIIFVIQLQSLDRSIRIAGIIRMSARILLMLLLHGMGKSTRPGRVWIFEGIRWLFNRHASETCFRPSSQLDPS